MAVSIFLFPVCDTRMTLEFYFFSSTQLAKLQLVQLLPMSKAQVLAFLCTFCLFMSICDFRYIPDNFTSLNDGYEGEIGRP